VVVSRSISLVVLLVTIIDPISGVPGGLINFSTKGSQGFSSFLFNSMKFIPGISSEMPRIFQENVSLFEILLLLALFKASGVTLDT